MVTWQCGRAEDLSVLISEKPACKNFHPIPTSHLEVSLTRSFCKHFTVQANETASMHIKSNTPVSVTGSKHRIVGVHSGRASCVRTLGREQ